MTTDPEEDFEAPDLMAALKASIDAAQQRIATVHERVECPTCSAPVGQPCRAMPKGFVGRPRLNGREIKLAHAQRLRADGTFLR